MSKEKRAKNLTSDDWREKGLEFHKSGDYEKAIECFDRAINSDNNNLEAYIDKSEELDIIMAKVEELLAKKDS